VKARDLELRDGLAPDDVERLLETVCGLVDS
jgi:hypothetical protein